MPQPNDLSRSLLALDQNSTIIAVVELSQSSWLVAGMLPGIERQPHKKLEPSPERLLAVLHRWRDEAIRAGRIITRIALAFEAGRDGFWLARWLEARGVEDYNNGHQEGFGYFQATQKNGRRWSTARAFLDPARPGPNLRIETEALATGVLLDGKRAVGVAYVQRGEAREARCGGEVILCAGAVKSPHLLELSGIGNPEILQSVGITVRHQLRGVGENYRDHYAPRMNWRVTLPITLNEQTRGIALVKEIVKYYAQRRGVLSLAAALVHGFVRTGPQLEVPDVQYLFSHASYSDPQVRALDREPGMTVTLYQCRPESTGSIHVKSPDPAASPAIRPNYLADELDRRTLVAGMKIARRIVNNKALDRYRAFEMNPGDRCQTDDELLGFARQYGHTAYHVVGTCKMGHDPRAVVDDELRVHGLASLRVVDASIMPTMTSGNTNAPVIMIAEKAADMVKATASRPARAA